MNTSSKRWLGWLGLAGAGVAAAMAASAQEAQVVVCDQGDPTRCIPVERGATLPVATPGLRVLPPAGVSARPAVPATGQTGRAAYWQSLPVVRDDQAPVRQPGAGDLRGTGGQAPGGAASTAASAATVGAYWQDPGSPPPGFPPAPTYAPDTSQVWLDWQPAAPVSDPTYALPGVCAHTPDQARARFSMAARSGDLNALLGAYQWRGKTHQQAGPIIARLVGIDPGGYWEASQVAMWTGVDDLTRLPAQWRWSNAGQPVYFSPSQADGCWFVEFSRHPGSRLNVRSRTLVDPAGGASPTRAAPTERQNRPDSTAPVEQEGVLVF